MAEVQLHTNLFSCTIFKQKKDLNSQKIKTRFVAQIYGTLARYVDFCPYNVPEFRDTQNIASVAQRLRDYWGLGQEPIQDMISLMERMGGELKSPWMIILVCEHKLRFPTDALTVPELPSEVHPFLMPIHISGSTFEQCVDTRKCSIQQCD